MPLSSLKRMLSQKKISTIDQECSRQDSLDSDDVKSSTSTLTIPSVNLFRRQFSNSGLSIKSRLANTYERSKRMTVSRLRSTREKPKRRPHKSDTFYCNPLNIILIPETRFNPMNRYFSIEQRDEHQVGHPGIDPTSWQYDSGVGSLLNEGYSSLW